MLREVPALDALLVALSAGKEDSALMLCQAITSMLKLMDILLAFHLLAILSVLHAMVLLTHALHACQTTY